MSAEDCMRELLKNARVSDDADGPIFEINIAEGTFKLEAVNGTLVTSGTLSPSEGASEFFERVGRHVIDYVRSIRS